MDSLDVSGINCEQTATTSDHHFVSFSCPFSHHRGPYKISKSGRKIKEIDLDLFKKDIQESDINDPSKLVDCETATDLYIRELRRILDDDAPVQEFKVTPNQSKWMNADCQNARRKRSKAERARKRHGTEASKIAYAIAYRHGEAVINTTKNAYYKNKLQECAGNEKETYKVVNKLMDRDLAKDIKPNNKPDEVICEEMKTYFKENIERIYSSIEEVVASRPTISPQEEPSF